ncbi:MAG: LLM class flavin-dependent oxidoreductase [Dehalococcoidia bacterium]|jgi:alkanesulfonate monooxygenase SsuD/methylene tetrahydromethanopterin reductase-like flavin-dependent oxidoreductase (luciferase family)|nr:LLM class flavin-dependent oxidoreductase [Dehalococcoidia bacterium]
MIKKFGTLYAGHVDLDDVGFAGTAANDRLLPNEELVKAFDKAAAIAEVLDRTGYDTFWLAEHHFQREGYEVIPNILMLATHLAGQTRNIRFGCGFNITPMWHPIRLAEDYALADILTGGRIVFGVGRGYHTREVETFGAPLLDNDANRDLFEEQVDIIFKAFNEDSFSHHGKHYDIPANVEYRGYALDEVTLVPRPLTRPVECYQPIQSATVRGLDFMVKHGIKGVVGGGAASGGAPSPIVEAWRDALARDGRDTELGTDMVVGVSVHIAETENTAMAEARSYFQENMKMFGPLTLARSLGPERVDALGDPKRAPTAGLPTIEDAVKSGQWLCGPPDLIVEKLMALQELYPGLEFVNAGSVIGTPQSVILEQLEQFSSEVMPHFMGA